MAIDYGRWHAALEEATGLVWGEPEGQEQDRLLIRLQRCADGPGYIGMEDGCIYPSPPTEARLNALIALIDLLRPRFLARQRRLAERLVEAERLADEWMAAGGGQFTDPYPISGCPYTIGTPEFEAYAARKLAIKARKAAQ